MTLRWGLGDVALNLRLNGARLARGSPGTIVQPSATGRQWQRRLDAALSFQTETETSGWSGSVVVQEHTAEFVDLSPPFGVPYDERVVARDIQGRVEGWRGVSSMVWRGGIDVRGQFVNATSLADGFGDHIREAGAWIQLEVGTALSSRSSIVSTLGIRADLHDLIDHPVISPRLGVVGRFNTTQIEFSVGNAYSPPGLSDLFFQENVLARANPELQPERVRPEIAFGVTQTLELGPTTSTLRATVFDADIKGMILWFPDAQFVWSPSNFDVHRQGVEIGIEAGGWPTRETHFSTHASWTRVGYSGDVLSGQVVYRPTVQGRANGGVRIGRVDVSASGRYVGTRRTVPGSSLNQLDPYVVLGAGIATDLALGSLRFRPELAVRNVLDTPAALLVDYPIPGRVWSTRVQVEHR